MNDFDSRDRLAKKQQLAEELDRLATIIEQLANENSRLYDVIDILVEEVNGNPDVKRCWFDKRDFTVHITWSD